jgi:hypothetical protein
MSLASPRIWYYLVFSAAFLLLVWCLFLWYVPHRDAAAISRDFAVRSERKFYKNIATAKALVRKITAELGAGRLRGTPQYGVPAKFSEDHPISYPLFVCDEDKSLNNGAVFYIKTSSGVTAANSLPADDLDGLRWVVIRTHGVFEKKAYGPSSMVEHGLTGFRMDEPRLFNDAWVVDLRGMAVVAHRRFVDDPLPDTISGDYFHLQADKIDDQIKHWLEEHAG